jgi:hypothetical protein
VAIGDVSDDVAIVRRRSIDQNQVRKQRSIQLQRGIDNMSLACVAVDQICPLDLVAVVPSKWTNQTALSTLATG